VGVDGGRGVGAGAKVVEEVVGVGGKALRGGGLRIGDCGLGIGD
jgi:hypothetical protein